MGIKNLLTRTNLDFLAKIRYSIITSLNLDKCVINFWCTEKGLKGFVAQQIFGTQGDAEAVKRFLLLIKKMMMTIQFAENYENKFRYIDVVFDPNYETTRLRELFGIEGASTSSTLGFVTHKDIDEDRNIVYLQMAELQSASMSEGYEELVKMLKAKGYGEKDARLKINSMKEELELQCEDNFIKTLSKTLVHELTHLWQIKQSQAIETQKRMRALFYSFIKPGEKYDVKDFAEYIETIFDKIKSRECTAMDLKNLIEILKKFYLILRQKFEDFRYSIIVEGIAKFVEKYVNGEYNYDLVNSETEKAAVLLDQDFIKMLKCFKDLVDILKNIVRGKNLEVDEIMEILSMGESEAQKRLSPMDDETLERYKSDVKYILGFYDRLQQYPYVIGPIIPATFFEYGMQIKEIGLINENEYISRYEGICVSKGIRPLISDRTLSDTNAVFNIGNATATFNALRRDLGITSNPQRRF